MAECPETVCENAKTDSDAEGIAKRIADMEADLAKEASDCFGRPGSQLGPKQPFKGKDGRLVWAYPVLVDFRRLLQLGQTSEQSGVIQGVSNHDLMHAVVGLYDVSLHDMTADSIYASVCEKWARTIVLVRDLQDTIQDLKERKLPDEPPSKFKEVYSDTDEEEDFSKGINAFINKAKQRREERNSHEGDLRPEDVGIENRLLGCATFEKKFVCQQKERVIHLTFISVRRRARKLKMGQFLLSKCLDPTIVGNYDAVVVHADNAAVDFFAKFGFSDDVVLNSKWNELAEQFTNCTLMCYLPGFSLAGELSQAAVSFGLEEMIGALRRDPEMCEIETDLKKWQQKNLEAYQAQVCCVKKMQHEIITLKLVMKRQSDLLNKLMDDNESVRKERLKAEKDLLIYRLETARCAFRTVMSSNGELGDHADSGDEDTNQLIQSLERQVSTMEIPSRNPSTHTPSRARQLVQQDPATLAPASCDDSHYMVRGHVRSQTAPYDHAQDVSIFCDIAAQFKQAMSADPSVKMQYDVSSINKAVLPSSVQEKFQNRVLTLADPEMVTQLYFCGTLEKPHRCQEVLRTGFSQDDFSHGEYGYGLYFSKHPSKAAQFSALGKLLLAEVGLGAVETVTKEDRTRKVPASGMDSVIVPGRLYRDDGDLTDGVLCQEYVIFNPAQVLPICLITYQAVTP
ncbi:hypothetical protein BaRGS_00004712 [Batillaria attramentaria]|uniref:PARP n=1 Tax=Batillaria attramentaria TaxID=370345 RepID=A0ABD0LWT2_9CAEN